MDTPEYTRCLSRLQKLCSKAEYCRADIYRKALKALDEDAEAAARMVASLQEDRYVDDGRYAVAFAREKALLQGWGPVKIRFQLRGKGVDEALITAALQAVEPDRAGEKLARLLSAKARSLQGDPQFRLKLLKYGLSRGYAYEAVEAACKNLSDHAL